MNLDIVKQGFLDELQKIGAIDTSGLSPETILNQKAPAPMETLGVKKALDVINRAESMKHASVLSPAMQLRASQKLGQPVLHRSKGGPSIKTQIRGALIGRRGSLPSGALPP